MDIAKLFCNRSCRCRHSVGFDLRLDIMKRRAYNKANVYRNVAEDMLQQNRDILERDGKCVLCMSRSNLEVHEIEPRSAFGSKTMHLCLSPRNRVTLCRTCHTTAHTRLIRNRLKQIIKDIYAES